MEGKTFFILLAMHPEAILYDIFNNEIGRQFLMCFLDLLPFGIHIMTPSFCVVDNLPFWNP